MAATPVALATKDNASGQLNGSISAATLSIALQSGNGANFPQPYTGTATSGGTATVLNSTGISAAIGGSAQEGKWIWNKTDGSVARIITGGVGTNAVTTTRLLGGTSNLWNNSDVWCLDPFVATFAIVNATTGAITQYEEALVTGRSTDTLTVATGGRGYNGTVANSFSAGDYVYLFVTSPIVARLTDVISVMAQQQDTDRTTLATHTTSLTNILNASSFYAVATGSANAFAATFANITAPLAAGMIFFVKANFTITGATTLTVTLGGSAQSATAIKKNDGATALGANDIISGQIFGVEFDGTNFQMFTPPGTPTASTNYAKLVQSSGTASTTLTNPTSETNFNTYTYTIPANDLVNGVMYRFHLSLSVTPGTATTFTFGVRLGAAGTDICTAAMPSSGNSRSPLITGWIMGTAAAGASVLVKGAVSAVSEAGKSVSGGSAGISVATNGTLALTFSGLFGTSNGGNAVFIDSGYIERVYTTAS